MRLGISKLVWKKYEDCSYIFLLMWIMVKWRSVVFYGINPLGVSLKLRDLWVDENTLVATDIFIPFNFPPIFMYVWSMFIYGECCVDAEMIWWCWLLLTRCCLHECFNFIFSFFYFWWINSFDDLLLDDGFFMIWCMFDNTWLATTYLVYCLDCVCVIDDILMMLWYWCGMHALWWL